MGIEVSELSQTSGECIDDIWCRARSTIENPNHEPKC